ncbi:MAG: acyl carrier protein [Lachnospiraceae bacterium]|nr:acyl carrier protein [Lachnospiraceae bacterium]
MRETIIKVLAASMDISESDLDESTVLALLPEFDSLQFIMVISELEENYQIDIPLDRALEVKTVGDLIECAEKRK